MVRFIGHVFVYTGLKIKKEGGTYYETYQEIFSSDRPA